MKDEVVSLPSSLEVKGIIGNDRRYYALDLFRIFPPDANFSDLPEGSKCRHKMAVLRPEFLDTFLRQAKSFPPKKNPTLSSLFIILFQLQVYAVFENYQGEG